MSRAGGEDHAGFHLSTLDLLQMQMGEVGSRRREVTVHLVFHEDQTGLQQRKGESRVICWEGLMMVPVAMLGERRWEEVDRLRVSLGDRAKWACPATAATNYFLKFHLH